MQPRHPRMMRLGVVLLAALASLPAHAVEPATEADREGFREALARFESRAEEMRTDTLRWVREQKARQLGRLEQGFTERLDEYKELERARRDEAMASFEAFLRRYDDVRSTSEVRLRLAELYYQEAQEIWQAESDRYYAAIDAAGDDLDRLANLEARGEPKLDLARVIALLTTVVDANEALPPEDRYALLDVAYYTLAYSYSEPTSKQQDRELARDTFRRLTLASPDSDYADAAHLMLGLYAFQDNDFEGSIPEFVAVLDRGEDKVQRKNYEAALYQLAWARYKLNDYDEAMARFTGLLDLSETRRLQTGRASNFEPEAEAYLALSLADVADMNSVAPLDQANAYFTKIGLDKPYRWDVLVQLADALVKYGRPYEAVDVYEYLQTSDTFRFRPENPEFQDLVVKLLTRGYGADLVAAGAARIAMTERYGEGSAWWDANRANPEAQEKARHFIEDYLLEVAKELKILATEANDTARFSAAADKYREYLQRFPMADNYFENQLQMADALMRAGRLAEAAAEFETLVRDAQFHDYGDPAVYFLFTTREKLLRELGQPPDVHVETAEVERTYTSAGNVEITVYELTDAQAGFVTAADAVIDHEFGPPLDDVGIDFRPVVDGNRSKILYLPAQVLYYANRYDEARPRLQKIFKEMPRTDEGAYAANLFLNTFINEGDSASVRKWSREFAGMALGAPSGDAAELSDRFQDTYEKTVYLLGKEAADRGDHAAAAEAFLAFIDEFPKSPNVPDAMLSAAFQLEKLGKADEANGLYERFLRQYPTHPDARPFFFRIASNYEATFQLDEAIRYYEAFLKQYPTDKEAPTAQYMSSFLKEGTGDALGAARGYEAYARMFPTVDDRAATHFRAGPMYELVDKGQAIQFYDRYLKSYGLANPDDAITAQARIAVLYTELGRSRDASSASAKVVKLYDDALAKGATVGPRGRDLAAEAAFPALQRSYDGVVDAKLTKDEKKNTKLLFETLAAEVADFDAEVTAFIERYLSFEYTTAAMYLQGAVRKFYADLGMSLTPPAGLGEDDQAAYWELLEERIFPEFRAIEQAAKEQFEKVIAVAVEKKKHSAWVDRARAGLNDIDASSYPAVKHPLPGKVEAVDPATFAPASPPPVEE
ncbi:MAG: tetratricopeptide repeat protein [Alphaproteobacteria bacterium]|nr:tetratricopeptide repeat protein [Alphaproteobacteria bacterium]